MSEVKVDTISERTAAAGVTIDGVLVKDGVATFQTAAGSPLVFEGATADAFETTFAITDPTADRTITFPDASITLAAGGGLLGLVVYTGDGTYTVGGTSNGTAGDEGSADVTKVIIEVQGGGGGGGTSPTGYAEYTQGGSGGGYAKKFIDVSSVTASVITVGAAGVGSSAVSGSAGTDGGDSSWVDTASGGSSTVTGVKGVGQYASYGVGVGGSATGGDINIKGGDSGGGGSSATAAGDSMFGSGGRNGYSTNNIATAGGGYGSGGGGRFITGGSDGAPGIVLIWEYA